MSNILFLHAHPDDEAIFTGGTISALSALGHKITVVFATNGECGINDNDLDVHLGEIRRLEAIRSCELLGVDNVEFLDYQDSGYKSKEFNEDSFAKCNRDEATDKVQDLLISRNISWVSYDNANGTYGHPDHIQGHLVGKSAANLANIKNQYPFTIDREYLRYLVTMRHVVSGAYENFDFGANLEKEKSDFLFGLGSSSVEIEHTIEIKNDFLKTKRLAMSSHVSQMKDLVNPLDDDLFHEIYGYEWFVKINSTDNEGSDSDSTNLLNDLSI